MIYHKCLHLYAFGRQWEHTHTHTRAQTQEFSYAQIRLHTEITQGCEPSRTSEEMWISSGCLQVAKTTSNSFLVFKRHSCSYLFSVQNTFQFPLQIEISVLSGQRPLSPGVAPSNMAPASSSSAHNPHHNSHCPSYLPDNIWSSCLRGLIYETSAVKS